MVREVMSSPFAMVNENTDMSRRRTGSRMGNERGYRKSHSFSHGAREGLLQSRGHARNASGVFDKDPREQKDSITVAVRFRPLSEKEKARGDTAVWGVDGKNTVGLKTRGSFTPKFTYDCVFRENVDNKDVYKNVAGPVVKTAMNGINGTIFAYGVTSSGKTHTMMGNKAQPGIVPQAIRNVFELIENMPSKEFLLRLSMMEIYNEILNDLLDPSRRNMKIREHRTKGVHVDGLREEVVLSAEHALQLIAKGETNRKISTTTFNDDSSRSHTLCRLSIEISDRIAEGEESGAVARTLSYLNLIDLAGSESAKAVAVLSDIQWTAFAKHKAAVSKGHRVEGSYINKSLLTLGTVIHKLSEGHAAHIPFRDSKLTRLLQSSLSGNGARVGIICTVTPTSAQTEETHNTLKFASRAKKIEIKCSRNEIMDEKSLIRRYQLEIEELKKELDSIASHRTAGSPVDGVNPHVQQQLSTLREQLEEEQRARVSRDNDKSFQKKRIERLTQLILTSTRAFVQWSPQQAPKLQRSRSFEAPRSTMMLDAEVGSVSTNQLSTDRTSSITTSTLSRSPLYSGCESQQYFMTTSAPRISTYGSDARGFFSPGADSINEQIKERNEQLTEQLKLMAEEMEARERDFENLKSKITSSEAQGAAAQEDSHRSMASKADSEHHQDSLEAENKRLHSELAKVSQDLQRAMNENRRLAEQDGGASHKVLFAPDQMMSPGAQEDITTETTQAEIGMLPRSSSTEVQHVSRTQKVDKALQSKLFEMEKQVEAALIELDQKKQQMQEKREEIQKSRALEKRAEQQLREMASEMERIKGDLQERELQNSRLQGYLLDGMSHEDLNELILDLTQAAERVRITVQLRRLSTAPTSTLPYGGDIDNKDQSSDEGGL